MTVWMKRIIYLFCIHFRRVLIEFKAVTDSLGYFEAKYKNGLHRWEQRNETRATDDQQRYTAWRYSMKISWFCRILRHSAKTRGSVIIQLLKSDERNWSKKIPKPKWNGRHRTHAAATSIINLQPLTGHICRDYVNVIQYTYNKLHRPIKWI